MPYLDCFLSSHHPSALSDESPEIKSQNDVNRGDCATCQVFIAGRATRACIGKVPPEPTLKSLQEKGLEVNP